MIAMLPAELTIAKVGELRAALLEALASGEPVELDGRAVEDADVAGLQVLCAAHHSAADRGVRLTFRAGGRSPALVRAVELAGLSRLPRERWLTEEEEGA